MPKTPNLTRFVLVHDRFWAIDPTIADRLVRQLESITVVAHEKEIEARGYVSSETIDDRDYDIEDGIAVISIVGPMTKAPTSFDDGCSTVRIRKQVRAAAVDPEVKAIMLRIDSPGGTVSGTEGLAKDVAAASKKKPTMAYCEDCTCSAAYWVAAQCNTIVANPTAIIGSIGTYATMVDTSEYYGNLGVKVHVISTGDYKGAGADGTEITDDQIADYQRLVDQINSHFLGAVSAGRKMSLTDVKKIADGRVWIASDGGDDNAKSLGLIDQVSSFDKAMSDLRAQVPAKNGTSAKSLRADEPIEPLASSVANADTEPATDEPLTVSVQDEALTPTTLESDLEALRISAESCTTRIEAVVALREQEDRPFSAVRLTQAKAAHEAMGNAITLAESLGTTRTPESQSSARQALAQAITRAELASATTR